MRRPAPGSAERAFFCRSDLKRLWTERSQPRAPRPLDAVFYALSEGQRDVIFGKLLLLISFLVYVDISPDWCLRCEAKLFKSKWNERSEDLEYEDTEGPLSEDRLRILGVSPTQAVAWERQFMFRPANITLNEGNLDEWIQEVDWREPVSPFSLRRNHLVLFRIFQDNLLCFRNRRLTVTSCPLSFTNMETQMLPASPTRLVIAVNLVLSRWVIRRVQEGPLICAHTAEKVVQDFE